MAGKSHNLRGSGEPNVPGCMRALGGMKPGDRIRPGSPREQVSPNYRERPNPEREWKREAKARAELQLARSGHAEFLQACALSAVLTEIKRNYREAGRNIPGSVKRRHARVKADVEYLRKFA